MDHVDVLHDDPADISVVGFIGVYCMPDCDKDQHDCLDIVKQGTALVHIKKLLLILPVRSAGP